MVFTRLQLSPLFGGENPAIWVACHCSEQPQHWAKPPRKSTCKKQTSSSKKVGALKLLVIPRPFCSYPLFTHHKGSCDGHLQNWVAISDTLKGISLFLWHNLNSTTHLMAGSTRQVHLYPCPFPSTFTYMFIAHGGHKILPPALGCVSKVEQGRSVPVGTPEHQWDCWYKALERRWLWPQRLNKAQH